MIFMQFLAVVVKFIFLTLEKVKNFELDIDPMFIDIPCAADTMQCAVGSIHYTVWLMQCMRGVLGMPGSVHPPSTYMEINKLLLNDCLGIMRHFESIFFSIWKMDFFRPPYPLNLENTIFLNPSLK